MKDLPSLFRNVFSVIYPNIFIITTPNADFNVEYRLPSKFRHPDHKFELNTLEFQHLCSKLCEIYPEYEVGFTGCGLGEYGKYCTQVAIFCRVSKEFFARLGKGYKNEQGLERSAKHHRLLYEVFKKQSDAAKQEKSNTGNIGSNKKVQVIPSRSFESYEAWRDQKYAYERRKSDSGNYVIPSKRRITPKENNLNMSDVQQLLKELEGAPHVTGIEGKLELVKKYSPSSIDLRFVKEFLHGTLIQEVEFSNVQKLMKKEVEYRIRGFTWCLNPNNVCYPYGDKLRKLDIEWNTYKLKCKNEPKYKIIPTLAKKASREWKLEEGYCSLECGSCALIHGSERYCSSCPFIYIKRKLVKDERELKPSSSKKSQSQVVYETSVRVYFSLVLLQRYLKYDNVKYLRLVILIYIYIYIVCEHFVVSIMWL